MITPPQLSLPDFEEYQLQWVCCICGEPASLFGQYSPLFDWGVCKACSIKHPYPVELFVESTRRNKDKEPYMIDPDAPAEVKERRIWLDEMVRCSIDPSRETRPIVKYNITATELRNPIRRSRMHQYNTWSAKANHNLTFRQASLPYCDRCGCAHDRSYEMLPGVVDYWSKCQRCDDELSVESLFNHRGIFGNDDDEAVLDRLHNSFPDLFERGVLPDYWFKLKQGEAIADV